MKASKTILAGAIAAALVSSAAQAADPIVLRICGATAYRNQTNAAIIKLLGGSISGSITSPGTGTLPADVNPNDTLVPGHASNNNSFGGAGYAIFKGYINNDGQKPVIIKTKWSGSVSGIATVSNGTAITFLRSDLPTATLGSFGPTPGANQVALAVSADLTDSSAPDACLSDVFQASTVYTANTLTQIKVGVIPFTWVASASAPASFNQMSPQQAQVLLKNGSMPLSFFTGAAADVNKVVIVYGRDQESGTRVTTTAEVGLGPNSTVFQYEPTGTLPATDAINPTLANQTLESGANSGLLGNFGNSSGGNVANNLRRNLAGTYTIDGTSYPGASITTVSYLGTADAGNAVRTSGPNLPAGTAAKIISYNGVNLHDGSFDGTSGQPNFNLDLVRNGKYAFWGYEHFGYLAGLAADKLDVATQLANKIIEDDPLIGGMGVGRAIDGGRITPGAQ